MTTANSKHSYRPDIDGLRAIAVVAVVLYHAGLGFPGGYTGVDVFFVISGYLITGLILRDLRQNNFSFLDFWERRARRILPALAVVVAFAIAVGHFILPPDEYARLARSVIGLALFSSNVVFYRENDYFGPAAESKPLLHTWSLSLEEQFYLLIPLFLWVLYRVGRTKLLLWGLAALTLLSFALSVVGVYLFPWATFFLLPTRAWELAVGSLLAFAKPVSSDNVRSIMSWLGLLGVLVPFFVYSKTTPFPGVAALPPVLGTALLIWSGCQPDRPHRKTGVARLLECKPVVFIGLISYSLYLWHWPLLAYNHFLELWSDSLVLKLGLLLLAFVLAAASWKFVEQPFRRQGLVRSRAVVFGASVLVVLALCSCAFLITRSEGFPEGRGRIVASLEEARIKAKRESNSTIIGRPRDLQPSDVPDKLIRFGAGNNHPARIFVWGDSHAEAALPGIDEACRQEGVGGLAAIRYGTAPTAVERNPVKSLMGKSFHNNVVMDYLRSDAARSSIRAVVLIANWSDYTKQQGFVPRLAEIVSELRDCGYKVFVMDEVPQWSVSVTKALGLQEAFGLESPFENGAVRLVDDFGPSRLSGVFSASKDSSSRVPIIDPLPVFSGIDGKPRAQEEGKALFHDSTHLSYRGAMKLVPLFVPIVQEASGS